MKRYFNKINNALLAGLALFSCSANAASTGTNPWETVLTSILDSLQGPVAYSVVGIAIIVTGLMMAFMDLQGGAKKLVQVALGGSIAFGAVSIITSFFSFSGSVI